MLSVKCAVLLWCVGGREAGQARGRQRRRDTETSQKGSNHARQRNRRGHSPQTPRGETPQGGKQPTGEPHPPTPPPLRVLYKKEEGRGARVNYDFFYSVQGVTSTSVKLVGTASPLAFQNCRGRPLNRPGSKVMTDGTSQFFLAIFALAFFCSHRRFSCE